MGLYCIHWPSIVPVMRLLVRHKPVPTRKVSNRIIILHEKNVMTYRDKVGTALSIEVDKRQLDAITSRDRNLV